VENLLRTLYKSGQDVDIFMLACGKTKKTPKTQKPAIRFDAKREPFGPLKTF
jgi:hypothetical protein